jgi:lipopolysaccharide export system protein LptA
MKQINLKLVFGACVLLTAGIALAAGSRVIAVTGDRQNGSPRAASIEFTGNVKGSVQQLKISADRATLTAPDGAAIVASEGKRTATFTNGVTVTRGRLTAQGPSLEYRETSGLGVLAGPAKIVQKPQKAGDDDVNISASKATFDVDTNVSTSEGNVKLDNGNQSAQASKVVYDEDSSLGCLTDARTVTLVREPKKAGENRITITAKEVRVNTDNNTLVGMGGVTIVSGRNRTTGDTLYFDDAKSTAYVVGRPAKNTDTRSRAEVQGTTLINNTSKEQVTVGRAFTVPMAEFKCPTDK